MVEPIRLDSADSHDLLSEAADLAFQSRDLFRTWNGPSHFAVVAAMQALLAMGDPQQAADLAQQPPHGEATESEASAPEVQAVLADAFLMLGRFSDIDTLHLEGIDESKATLIRAMQAAGLGDNAAPSRIRRVLALASRRTVAPPSAVLVGVPRRSRRGGVVRGLRGSDAALFRRHGSPPKRRRSRGNGHPHPIPTCFANPRQLSREGTARGRATQMTL